MFRVRDRERLKSLGPGARPRHSDASVEAQDAANDQYRQHLHLLCVGFVISPTFGDTTFANSTLESLDRDARQLAIRTGDGNSCSLQVESADLMKGLEKGDRISLEIGPDDQMKKIVKSQSGGSERSSRNEPSDS